jgi:MFS family permease
VRPVKGQAVAALRHRDFAVFWVGALVSNVGTWMQNVTVPYVIFQLTRSAGWVGLAAFASLFPSLLLGPLAGSLADRFDRRRLLLWSQVVQAALAFGLWGAWICHWRSPALLIAIVSANGCAFGVTMPSWQAFLTQLVPRADLLNAVTLNSAQFNAARAFGPAIGGLILGRFGPSWAFLANALSFAAVIAALAAVRPVAVQRAKATERVLVQFAEGLRYARRHSGILLALILCGCLSFLGTPVIQLTPVLAKRVYHVGPGLYGLLIAVFGSGAVLGAGLLGLLGDRWPKSRLVVVGVGLYATGLILIGLTGVYAVGLVGLAVCGVAFLTSMATLNTTIQLQVAERIRGRVLALWMMGITGAYPLGALLQGWLADQIGARTTVLGAGLLMAAVVVVVASKPGLAATVDEHTHRRQDVVPGLPEAETILT